MTTKPKEPYQPDMFAATLVDARLRDERDAMEFPLFSLAKKKRIKPIEYNRHGVEILVTAPAETGIATIWDADFLIWVASQWNAAIERKEPVSPRIWMVPNHYLLQTGRIKPNSRGGKPYIEFEDSLNRL
jgi:plasmid replication initiation protein